MAAQGAKGGKGGRQSIHEVHQRELRHFRNGMETGFMPAFDSEGFCSALWFITGVVEGLCLWGAEGWDERQRLVPDGAMRVLLTSRRSLGLPSAPPILVGDDRAVRYLTLACFWRWCVELDFGMFGVVGEGLLLLLLRLRWLLILKETC